VFQRDNFEKELMKKQKPEFICIGTQRSGTTWLYAQFKGLKNFALPYIKEYHYFDRTPEYPSTINLHGKSILERLKRKVWLKKNISYTLGAMRHFGSFKTFIWRLKFYWHLGEYDDKWYLSTFKNLPGVTGEFTPEYALLKDEDIARMAKLLPDIKIIYILRDPIARTWSHIRYNASKKGQNKVINTEVVIKRFETKSHFHDHVNYLENISRYARHFSPENILITFFDDIANRPQEMLAAIISELGISHQESNKATKKVNASREEEIPEVIYSYLKNRYSTLYKSLDVQLGGYASQWYAKHYETAGMKSLDTTPLLVKASDIL
jgi:exoribonuclease R